MLKVNAGLFASLINMGAKSKIKSTKKLLSFTLLALSGVIPVNSAFADGVQTFTKELQGSQNRDVGEVVTYLLKPACNSLTSDCGTLSIIDNLPTGMVVDSCSIPPGFSINGNSCDAGSTSIDISKDTTYNGGDSFIITVKGLIKLDTASGTVLTNSADATITAPTTPANATLPAPASPVTVNPTTPNWSLKKVRTSPAPPLLPTWDTDVSYKVSICSDSAIGNISLTGVQLNDVFPANVVTVSDGGADASTATSLTWDIDDNDLKLENLYAGKSLGSKQCVSKSYTLKYPDANFDDGDAIPNTISATNTSGATIDDVTLNDVIGIPTPGARLGKSGNDVLRNEDLIWYISANINASNAPVPELKIYETIPQSPAGLTAKSVTSGRWNSPATTNGVSDVRATITYSITDVSSSSCDDLATDYSNVLDTNIASPASSITYPLPVNATCVRWEYSDAGFDGPDVPRGWRTVTNARLIQNNAYAGVLPITVTNDVKATFLNFDNSLGSASRSATLNIEEETPEIILSKTASANNLAPTDETQFTLRFRHDKADSTGSTLDPVVTDLLPPEFEFVSWDSVTGLGGENEPNLEIISDFNGTGRALLRYSWAAAAPVGSVKLDGTAGVNNSASFDENSDVIIKFTVRVKPGTTANTYNNATEFYDNGPRFTCNSGTIVDTEDLDGDGNTTEEICEANRSVTVVSASVINGDKWVKGDSTNIDDPSTNPAIDDSACPNDGNGFTRYPCVAQTTHGGDYDYAIKVLNSGNEPLKDYILYDVLPATGDTGVGEPLSTLGRGTVWRAELLAAVTPTNPAAIAAMAQTGSVVEYTSSDNACRNEVSATTDESGWQSGCIDDWTDSPADFATVKAFRIVIPFADTSWQPLEQLEFGVQMKAPVDAPSSILDDAANFNPAWNSFAHRVTQVSNNSRLATAEPRQVGIVLPPKYRLGNLVWLDANLDGNADDGEPGIAGVDVELWIDDDGTPGPSAGDTHVVAKDTTTDSDGHYAFNGLDEGDYYVVIPNDTTQAPLAGLGSSTNGEEANPNDDGDNNDNGVNSVDFGSGNPVGLSSGVVTLGTSSEPTNEELRLGEGTDDDNDAFPDALSNLSVDFGFVPSVSIGSIVWEDINKDGAQTTGEPGISGAVVELFDASDLNTVVATQTTLGDGLYYFGGLPPGDYVVKVTMPDGFAPTINQQTGDNDDSENDSNIASSLVNEHTSGVFTLTDNGEPTVDSNIAGSDDADNLDDNNGNMTVDFGFVRTLVSIGSTLFYDDNNDGLQNNGDAGIPNQTVNLYLDADGNGVPDGAAISSQTTNGSGDYFFGNLALGKYIVGATAPTDAPTSSTDIATSGADNQTDGDDNGAQLNSGDEAFSPTIELTPGSEPVAQETAQGAGQDSSDDSSGDMTVDFGFVKPVSIGSVVWDDTNNNGIQDDGELGIGSAAVELLDSTGNVVATQNTDPAGLYFFDGLLPGDYSVRVTPPAGYQASAVQNTADNDDAANDSNIASTAGNAHTSGVFTLEIGNEPDSAVETGGLAASDDADNAKESSGNMTVDFGFYKPVTNAVSIGSVVWDDTNNNGIQETGESGIAGATLTLLDGSGTVVPGIAPITTGSDGLYFFDNLPEGDYQVQVELTGFVPSANQVTDANSDADNDTNIATTVGNVFTSGVVTLGNNAEPSGEAGVLGGEDQDSSDDNNGNMTVDFGFFKAVPNAVSIGSVVWNDNNDNGKQDAGEAGIVGATVTLLDASGTPVPGVAVQTTGSDGLYYFGNLPEGSYQVQVTPPAGFVKSTLQTTAGDDDAADDSNIATTTGTDHVSGTFTLTNDGEPTVEGGLANSDAADNADEDNGNMTVDFGFFQPVANPVSIGSVIWEDSNLDGIQDSGEPTISGVVVTLLDGNGVAVPNVAPQTTGADGQYFFGNLPEGDYQVQVTPPAGFVPTFAQESNADGDTDNDTNIASSNGGDYTSGTVSLTSGGEPTESGGLAGSDDGDSANETSGNMTVDFGFIPSTVLGALSGNVSEDTTGDGNANVSIPGVTLQLLDATGNPVLDPITGTPLSTTTDANGDYSFANLIPGDYIVVEIQPGGFITVSDVDGGGQPDSIGDGTPISVPAGGIAPANNFIERRNNEPIPTLSEWALLLLMMMLGFVGYRQGLTRKD